MVAIRAENLGKQYRLGRLASYRTFRESIRRWVAAPVRRIFSARSDRRSPISGQTIWALRDVSFEVDRGEVFGIIGHNGAGKSTLLRILSRITIPTTGRARIHGRVGTLLEVGTGFHPELTGRENIFFNGAILGMTRAEITRKFDRIVDFSGVEEFLDTPVKRYSSGMWVRLAFAVAAHLEPENLLVDEVLAVGDIEFQKKCLGKMSDVAKGGRTILFTSHNMGAVSRLCQRTLVLRGGHPAFLGPTHEAVAYYVGSGARGVSGRADLRQAPRWPEAKLPILTSISTHRPDGSPASAFAAGDAMLIRVGCRLDRDMSAYCQVTVSDQTGERLVTLRSTHAGSPLELPAGEGAIECRVDDLRLLSGEYTLSVEIGSLSGVAQCLDSVSEALRIYVHLGNYLGGADVPRGQGWFAQRSAWNWRPPVENGADGEAEP